MDTIIMPPSTPKKPISGAFYGLSGYGVFSTASITAWLALGNDPILTTLADGTRELVNSKGVQAPTFNPLLDEINILTADNHFSSASNEITGTTYYFSSSTGNDANDGLTELTAKKSYYDSVLLRNSLTAGDGILYKRGDVWNADDGEDFTSLNYTVNGDATNPIIFSCYGIGARPKFNGILTQSAITWTLEIGGDFDGLWSCTPVANTTGIKKIEIDGVTQLKSNTPYLLLTDPLYTVSHYIDGDNKLYTNVDPTTVTFRWADTSNTFSVTDFSTYFHVKHLHFENARRVSIVASKDALGVEVMYCTAGDGTHRGITTGSGSKVMYNTIKCVRPTEHTYQSYDNLSEGITISTEYVRDRAEIAFNNLTNAHHGSIMINGIVGGAVSTGAIVHDNYMENTALMYGCRMATQYRVQNMEVYNNMLVNVSVTQLDGDFGHWHHNLFLNGLDTPPPYKTYNTGQAISFNITAGSQADSNIIENNMFYKCDGAGVTLGASNNGTITNTIVQNNVFFDCGELEAVYPTTSPFDLNITILNDTTYTYQVTDSLVRNNISFNSSAVTKTIAITTNSKSDINLPENNYTVAEVDIATLDNGTVFENNISLDPLFADNLNYDFRGLVGSSMWGAGIAPTSTKDINGIDIVSPYNLGLYDSQKEESKNVLSTTGRGIKFDLNFSQRANNITESLGDVGFITLEVSTTTTSYLSGQTGGNRAYIKGNGFIGLADSPNIDTGILFNDVKKTVIIQWNNGVWDIYTSVGETATGTYLGTLSSTGRDLGGASTYGSYSTVIMKNYISGNVNLSQEEIDFLFYSPETFLYKNSSNVISSNILNATSLSAIENHVPLWDIGSNVEEMITSTLYPISGYTTDCNVSGITTGLQTISFKADGTKADTMHISTDCNQIIAVVPTEAYTVKWTTSNNTTYELSTFTTNIDTNQMLAHMGASDAEIKSIEII